MLSELLKSGEDTKKVCTWTSLQGSVLQGKFTPFFQTRIMFTSSAKCFLEIILSSLLWLQWCKLRTYYLVFGLFEVDPYLVSQIPISPAYTRPSQLLALHFSWSTVSSLYLDLFIYPPLSYSPKGLPYSFLTHPFLLNPRFHLWKSCCFPKI